MTMIRKLTFALLAFFAAAVSAAPAITSFTATASAPNAPANVTLNWASTGSDSCTASGGWTGTKTISGTATITGVLGPTSYTLTCYANDGTATVSWVLATQYTNNTPYTDPRGVNLYHSTSSALTGATATLVLHPGTSYTLTGLPPGLRYFGAKSLSLAGVESPVSPVVSKTVTTSSASASASVSITPQPKAPTGTGVQ